jgi:hypothetical protein
MGRRLAQFLRANIGSLEASMPERPDYFLSEREAARVAIFRSFLEGSLDANQATARLLALDLEARSGKSAEPGASRTVSSPRDLSLAYARPT